MASTLWQFRLRTALVLPFVLQIVAAVGLVGYLSFRNGQKAVTDLANQLMIQVSDRTYRHLDDYLLTPHQINQINIDAIETGLLDINDLDIAGLYFWKQVQAFDNLGFISYGLSDGRFIGAGPVRAGEGISIAEVSARTNWKINAHLTDGKGNRIKVTQVAPYDTVTLEWYTQAAQAGKPIWTSVYSLDELNFIAVGAMRPMYAKGKLIGVIGVDLQLSNITNFLHNLNFSKSGRIFIMERDGQLIGNSGPQPSFIKVNNQVKRFSALNISDPAIQAAAKALQERFGSFKNLKNSARINIKIKGENYFVLVAPWQDKFGLDWPIVTVVPESDFMGQINANTRTTIILCAIAFTVATAIGIFTARWIATPIEAITQASEYMANGDLDRQVKTSSLIELKKLANSFNSMAGQLKESFETLEDKVTQRTSELATANAEIVTLNQRLKAENMRMSAELYILKQMQQLILPKHPEMQEIEDLDIAGFMEPADEVGGDYYDILHTDGVVTIGIGDVTGHGLESGILMVMTQAAVRTLHQLRESDPVRFLDTINRTIYQNIQRMSSDKNLTLAILNYACGTISISGQHEETIVVRKNGKIERIDTIDLGFPIGLDENISELIHQVLVKLEPGDGVVLYTDGIPEARNIYKKFYGIERLCEVVSINWHKSSEEIKQSAIDDLREFIGEQKVFDDITLVIVKLKDGLTVKHF
ncbi:SpoIIE family protein phosphatase [Microcoleus sp. bin38.metabat.b11b12b14.051]|uniref:SpoIIE family protein phosphatase n=1 Tax=Microcoleus sp. bin38.metabat.b11b12b14.051 TaxID=2742709 RepID=UPI0025D171AF|nr:SpoIIE family protein phosphatase [Microcoleus sp. bin38.metabat.b11b12b14.051]